MCECALGLALYAMQPSPAHACGTIAHAPLYRFSQAVPAIERVQCHCSFAGYPYEWYKQRSYDRARFRLWTALSIELPEDSGRTNLAHKLLGSVAPLSYPCPDALVGSARPDAGRASRPGGRYGFKGSVAMPQQVWARHCTVTLGSISVFWRRHSHRVGGALFGFTGAPDYLLSTWMDGLATDFRVEAGSTAGLADVPPGFSSCSSGRASSSMLACPLAQSLHPFVHVNILLLHLSSLSIILPAAH